MQKQNKIIIFLIIIMVSSLSVLAVLNIIGYRKVFNPEHWTEQYLNDCSQQLFCKKFRNNENLMSLDAPSQFFYVRDDEHLRMIPIIMPILIIILSAVIFKLIFKNKNIANYLTRKNYKKHFSKSWLKTYLSLSIIPIFYILYLIFNIISTGHFDTTFRINYFPNIQGIPVNVLDQWYLVFLVFLINITLHYTFVVNLVIINFRKIKNIVLGVISTFISYMLVFVFVGVFIQLFIYKHWEGSLNLNFGYIWIEDYEGVLYMMLFNIALILITSVIIKKLYKNKEKVLIDNE